METGEIYLNAGMTRQAARYINEAANLAPTRGEKDVIQLRAVALFESIGDYRLTVARILDLGIDAAMQGDYLSSITKFREGYEVARLRDAKPSMVASLSNLGQVYTYQNDFAKALDHLIRASEIRHPSVGTNLQGDILLNIGTLYHGIGEYELALSKFREALPVFEKIDHGLRREEFLENRVEGSGSGLGGQLPVTFAEVLRLQVLSKDLAGEGGTQGVEIDTFGDARNVPGLNRIGEVIKRHEGRDHEDGPA